MSVADEKSRDSSGERSLEPDTFWELVEKLLLRSSRDERIRQGHNLSLSALCRGYAVSTVPRDRKQSNAKDVKAHAHSKKLKTGSDSVISKKKIKLKTNKSQNEAAKKAASECSLKDHDVVYLKDTDIPASERLWRFAIKNRKKKEGQETSPATKPERIHVIPSARSNEAIYEGLKHRLEEARKTAQENVDTDVAKKVSTKPKRRKKRQRSTSHLCDSQKKEELKVTPKKTKTISSANVKDEKRLISNSRASKMSSKGTISAKSSFNGASSDSVNLLKESSENSNAQVRSVTPEQVEAKKNLYDSVLRKRLHCGSQLETLNKEIVNKKVNPRLVLSRETTRKYAELKTEYLKLCYQESSLRHQIAILQAEIYMMQNKNFHKQPAALKTITLNSDTAKIPRSLSAVVEREVSDDSTHGDDVLLFPRLKAPRPLIVPLNKQAGEKKNEAKDEKQAKRNNAMNDGIKVMNGEMINKFPSIEGIPTQSVCSLYSLTTSLAERHPKSQFGLQFIKFSTRMALDDKDEISAAYEEVRRDESSLNWCCLKYNDCNKIVLDSKGEDFDELKSSLSEDERAYIFLRVQTGDEMSKRMKFAVVVWMGKDVSAMKRAKMSIDKAQVKSVFVSFAVELLIEEMHELREDKIKEQLIKAGGANYGTGR
ncbi:Coactosin-like protein [Mactra antiquata]